jgi:hypothetical protein
LPPVVHLGTKTHKNLQKSSKARALGHLIYKVIFRGFLRILWECVIYFILPPAVRLR